MGSRRMRTFALSVLAWIALAAAASPVSAAPGDLDPSWSGDGRLVADPTATFDPTYGVAVQDDGKVVVVGFSAGRIFVARYLTDGTLDATFSGDGKVVTDLGPGSDGGVDVAIQADDKIVVAGNRNMFSGAVRFALVRYDPDGTLDTTFSGDGRVSVDFPGAEEDVREVAIQDDGRIVVAGESRPGQGHSLTAVARYTAGGAPDPTFSGDGFRAVDVGVGYEGGQGLAVQPDGRILVTSGLRGPGTPPEWRTSILRFTVNGQLDPTWSGDGRVVRSVIAGFEDLHAMGLADDGTVLVAGEGAGRLLLQRYLADGTPDDTFAGDGVQVTNLPGGAEWITSLARQADGKVVVAGGMAGGGGRSFVARYLIDGTLDTGYSGDGFTPLDFSAGRDLAMDLALQADEAAVIAATVADDRRYGIARFLAT